MEHWNLALKVVFILMSRPWKKFFSQYHHSLMLILGKNFFFKKTFTSKSLKWLSDFSQSSLLSGDTESFDRDCITGKHTRMSTRG